MSVRRRSSRLPSHFTASCPVVGDSGVGKSCMILAHLLGKFIKDYLPGPVDWHSEFDHVTRRPMTIEKEGVEVQISIVDTVGLDEYQKLREKVCAQADVFLICFDVNRPSTLDNVREHWVEEVKEYSPSAPFILVGTRTDERHLVGDDGRLNKGVVHTSQGEEVAKSLNAFSYVECSAHNLTGLKNVFEHAAMAFLEKVVPQDGNRKSCVVS